MFLLLYVHSVYKWPCYKVVSFPGLPHFYLPSGNEASYKVQINCMRTVTVLRHHELLWRADGSAVPDIKLPSTLLQSSVAKACGKMEPTWKAVAQLVTLIQPYLTQTHASSVVKELSKVIHTGYSQD